MKQLVILSGKGGTGKTNLSAAFAYLGSIPEYAMNAVFVDADVDAANLGLVIQPNITSSNDFWGGSLAEIDPSQCSGCGTCATVCRYDAIHADPIHPDICAIDPIACDGCAACVYACPQKAIRMIPQQEGYWMLSNTPFGALFHAELFPGKENSGKLVTMVKQQARLWAEERNESLVIIDGPPGIGCPVISACAGVDLGLIVTEPGLAGLHDLKRVLETLQHFHISTVICINKADVYPQGTNQIREFAALEGIEIVGEIPFDHHVHDAILLGAPITQSFPNSPAARSIQLIWAQVLKLLFNRKAEA